MSKKGYGSAKDGDAVSGVSRMSKGRISKKSLTTQELKKFFESNKQEIDGDAKSRFSQLSRGQVSKFKMKMIKKIEDGQEVNAPEKQ